ncbi:MAG: hypothetical protein ACRC50_12755 [Gaiella sp.]
MTSIHREAPPSGRVLASRRVDVSEARSFARDLGGTLTHVLVAAAGRGLAASESGATDGVALAVARLDAVDVIVLPGACSAPLPRLRREIDAALGAAVHDHAHPDQAALAVLDVDAPPPVLDEVLDRSRYVLEATPCGEDPRGLALVLHAEGRDADRDRAEALLRSVSRFVERPYRRLV